jgi:lipopolysaccharide/colanic/teichoic acid biosynthesis glycosyltransferase
MQESLAALAHQLSNIATQALDRTSYADRRRDHLMQLRQLARLTTLEAAAICIGLHVMHGGSANLPPRHKLPRPTPRMPTPSRLPTVATNVLAHAFATIYIDFALLEARITGLATPSESLVYVRDAGNTERRDVHALLAEADAARKRRLWFTLKPILDRIAATLLSITLAPILATIAAAIYLTDAGPVLFRQVRVGKFGREFVLYKFRTMVDVDALRSDLLDTNELDGPIFKLRADPRITRFGMFLRRISLDELPQLFNIIRGDMSLVGPRPPLPAEVDMYDDLALRRLLVTPGMTGLWQVSGRSDLSWGDSLALDLEYVKHCSPRLDAAILWRTASAVFRGTGAY